MSQTPSPGGVLYGPVDALALARRWHGHQVDKLGEDYVDGHLARVARAVAKYGDPHLSVAAALHDVLEDTAATPEDLATSGVSPEALGAVRIVTKRADEHGTDGYTRFIERVGVSGSPRALRLKLADLEDHLRPLDTEGQPFDDGQRQAVADLRGRYAAAAEYLLARLRELEGEGAG